MNANIGKLNNGKCYVFLYGDNKPPIYGTEAELEALINKHGVVNPIPVVGANGEDLTDYPKPSKKARVVRIYRVTLTTLDYVAGVCMEPYDAGTVSATDRNEAMRKARDIIRDNVGPYGPRTKASVRLI